MGIKIKTLVISNSFLLMLIRIVILYILFAVCRVVFYLSNASILAEIEWVDLGSIFKGAFIYDSASIFYMNVLFVALSLIPFQFRTSRWWQKIVAFSFFIPNSLAFFVYMSDIVYFPYKLSRIAGDDLVFFGEDNFSVLFWGYVVDYWQIVILYVILVVILYMVSFKWIKFKNTVFMNNRFIFYTTQPLIFILGIGFSILAIRGYTVSKASFPLDVSDVTRYVEPKYSAVTLSNPFCLLRTIGKSLNAPKLTSDEISLENYSTKRNVPAVRKYSMDKPNIMILVLESFGTAHIKPLSDDMDQTDVTYTPFLDSLFSKGAVIPNAYQNTIRSIDAMPAIWASVPSYKRNLLSHPQSITDYNAMPVILKKMGYTTSFMHGAEHNSMSLKAFGNMSGVDNYLFRGDYESENGTGHFDGKWGIWDDKFLPYAAGEINKLKEPFLCTIFTLSSHNPFLLPEWAEGKFEHGKLPIHRTIRYSDEALRVFFEEVSKQSWYENTLFIITADHSEGAVGEKWKGAPYNRRVPIFFYTPNGTIESQKVETVASHVDIMPTVLGVVGADEPFFSYGRDIFNNTIDSLGGVIGTDGHKPFIVHYNSSTFNVVTDKLLIQFDDFGLFAIYDYINDPYREVNLKDKVKIPQLELDMYKAYIQSYYTNLKNSSFKVGSEN